MIFIEIMGCPGVHVSTAADSLRISHRARTCGRPAGANPIAGSHMPVRKSHENPSVKTLYREYLGTPGSMISHKLLHTTYTPGKFTG